MQEEHSPMAQNEGGLVARWLAGDTNACAELLRMHRACLYRFFRNKLGNSADDLVQETMEIVLSCQERFEGRSTFRAFLLSIARHRLFEYYRKKELNQRYFEFDTVTVFDMCPSPSIQVAEKGEQRLLLEALRHIPLNYQIVLELHYWEDLTGPEIAEAVSVPVDTVYSRLRIAKALLKEQMERLANCRETLDNTLDHLDQWAGDIRDNLAAKESPNGLSVE